MCVCVCVLCMSAHLGLQTPPKCGSCMIYHHQYVSLDSYIKGNLRLPILHFKIPVKNKIMSKICFYKSNFKMHQLTSSGRIPVTWWGLSRLQHKPHRTACIRFAACWTAAQASCRWNELLWACSGERWALLPSCHTCTQCTCNKANTKSSTG